MNLPAHIEIFWFLLNSGNYDKLIVAGQQQGKERMEHPENFLVDEIQLC